MSINSLQRQKGAVGVHLCLAGADYRITGIPRHWLEMIPGKLLPEEVDSLPPGENANQLDLSLVTDGEHLRPAAAGHNLNETSRLRFSQHRVEYQSDWCLGYLEIARPLRMTLECHSDAGPYFGGMLENALRIMTAYDVLLRGGILMHSNAIVMNGSASVLFGHSGAGKSTTSRIAMQNGHAVLSDDINVLLSDENGWQVLQVPFCGSVDSEYAGPGVHPLTGLYRLHKDTETKLGEYSAAHATSVVCGSAPFINQDPYRSDLLLDRAQNLVKAIPVMRLYFRPDNEFLELIGDSD